MRLRPTLSSANVEALIETLWRLERSGRFEEGLVSLSEDWRADGILPETSGIPEPHAARLQLRFAALLGYQGHIARLKSSQLRARDILTACLASFEGRGEAESAAECENHIALTYWRTGEFQEADVWLEAAAHRDLAENSLTRLSTIKVKMIVNIGKQQFEENVELFSKNEIAIRKHGDEMLNGSCHLNVGIAFMELGQKNEALRCIELAKFFYESGSINVYLGAVENELAHVYLSLGKFAQAHSAVDRGIKLFRKFGDETREGFLYDTKASISLEEGDLGSALMSAERAICVLRETENTGFLAESYLTEAKVLLNMGRFTSAVSALFEGVQLAKTNSGEAFASKLIEQFERELRELRHDTPRKDRASYGLETGELTLVLPPEIDDGKKIKGIWINNDHLESAGLKRGCLAVAVNEHVERGDLAAVIEVKSGEVSCGFYDTDFGMVCLEGCDREPMLFGQEEVELLGKIVGLCDGNTDDRGRMIVTLLRHGPRSSKI